MNRNDFKSGDLVTLDSDLYSKFAGQVGVIIDVAHKIKGVQFIVMIGGKVYPYYVDSEDMARA